MTRRRLQRVDAGNEALKILGPSATLEKDYTARLRMRVRETRDFTVARLEAGGSVADMNSTEAVDHVNAAARTWTASNPPNEVLLGGFARSVDLSTTRGVRLAVSRISRINVAALPSGADATALNAAFVRENVSLIKSIDTRYFDDIARVVQESMTKGRTKVELSTLMQDRFNVSKSRGDLIARDQTAKLNGNITQLRQRELGVTKYTWLTSEDERVREEHAVRNGDVFEWDKPPFDGHPGEPINCRCVALPVVDL